MVDDRESEDATQDPEGLLARSQAGDPVALDTLLARHLPGVRAFARLRMSPLLRAHESGSDIVQSACRELLAKRDGFVYQGEEAFRGWLYTAVLHKLRSKERDLRAQKRDPRRVEQGFGSDGESRLLACYSQVLSPTRQLVSEERIRLLEAAFDDLPEPYREVITLSRIARLSRAQVAERMQRTEDSVRNLLSRALVALAEALDRRDRSPGTA